MITPQDLRKMAGSGTGRDYYLVNGEADCGGWLPIAGPMGFADGDADPLTEVPTDRIPAGILGEASCAP